MERSIFAGAALTLPLVIAMMTALGHAADVDWKVYGSASVSGPEICFYDAKSVARRADKLLRVWTKCLSQQDLDKVNVKNDYDGKIVENAARKMVNGYVPPIALVEDDVDFDKATMITGYEESANIADIEPHARIFYELDCSERMSRELSINLFVDGKRGGIQRPGDWKYIPPEGNAARLLKLLCA
jgi:hypothetical protein